MFNWFFNLFKQAADNTDTLTKKADSEPTIQPLNFKQEQQNVEEKLSDLRRRLERRCEDAGNIVSRQESANSPTLHKIYNLGITRKEVADRLLTLVVHSTDVFNASGLTTDDFINPESLEAKGYLNVIGGAVKDGVLSDSALDDAVAASIYDFMFNFSLSEIGDKSDVVEDLSMLSDATLGDDNTQLYDRLKLRYKNYIDLSRAEIDSRYNNAISNHDARRVERRNGRGGLPRNFDVNKSNNHLLNTGDNGQSASDERKKLYNELGFKFGNGGSEVDKQKSVDRSEQAVRDENQLLHDRFDTKEGPARKDLENTETYVDTLGIVVKAVKKLAVSFIQNQQILREAATRVGYLMSTRFTSTDEEDKDNRRDNEFKGQDSENPVYRRDDLEEANNEYDAVYEGDESEMSDFGHYQHNFYNLMNDIRQYAGDSPWVNSTMAVLHNFLADKAGIFDDPNVKQRPLSRQRTALQRLQDLKGDDGKPLNIHIFDTNDVDRLFRKKFDSYMVPDPGAKDNKISLTEFRTTIDNLKFALQYLQIIKRNVTDPKRKRKSARTLMNVLDRWVENRHPALDDVDNRIKGINELLEKFDKKEQLTAEDKSRINQLNDLKADAEREKQMYSNATGLNEANGIVNAIRDGMANEDWSGKFVATVTKQARELINKYEDHVIEYTLQAVDEARTEVIKAATVNESQVMTLLRTKPEFKNNETFIAAVKHHYLHVLQDAVSNANSMYLDEFLSTTGTTRVNEYVRDAKETRRTTPKQLSNIMDYKYSDELASYTLWFVDRFDKRIIDLQKQAEALKKEGGNYESILSQIKNETDNFKSKLRTALGDKAKTDTKYLESVFDKLEVTPAKFISEVYNPDSESRKIAFNILSKSDPALMKEYQKETNHKVSAFRFGFNPDDAADILYNNDVVRANNDYYYGAVFKMRGLNNKAEAFLQKEARELIYDLKDVQGFGEDRVGEVLSKHKHVLERGYELSNELYKAKEKLIDKIDEFGTKNEAEDDTANKELNRANNNIEYIDLIIRIAESGEVPQEIQDMWEHFDTGKPAENKNGGFELVNIFPDTTVAVRDGIFYKAVEVSKGEFEPTKTPLNSLNKATKKGNPPVVDPILWGDDAALVFFTGSQQEKILDANNVPVSDKAISMGKMWISSGDQTQWYTFDPLNPDELGDKVTKPNKELNELGEYKNCFDTLLNNVNRDAEKYEDVSQRWEQEQKNNRIEPNMEANLPEGYTDALFMTDEEREQVLKEDNQKKRENVTEYVERNTDGDDNGDNNHTGGFSFTGLKKEAAFFHFAEHTAPFIKVADGLNAFTSDEDLQKAVEEPFGDSMSSSEEQIKDQRQFSEDNTSNQGETSSVEDASAQTTFSSKELVKAFKAAYEKDPGTFDDLLKLVNQSGSTGTFAAEVLSKLPEVNWVPEAALRKYNETAQQPVHRNSFQQALKKANDEQLSKSEMFKNICRNILNGKPA